MTEAARKRSGPDERPRVLGEDIWALDSASLPWRCRGYGHRPTDNRTECWERVTTPVTLQRISNTATCVWAVDSQYGIHLFLKESNLPLRIQEFQFKYERNWITSWQPVVPPQKESGKKFSVHWKSESVWRIDYNVGGTPTDRYGWQYANSVTSTEWKQEKTSTTFIRRQREAHYHEYTKMGQFAKIESSINFFDVSAGGNELHSKYKYRSNV
eukprot:sb/3470119/